jgi:hypothetical protein
VPGAEVEAVEAENLGNKAEKRVKLKSSDDEVIKVGEPLGDAGHELLDGKSVGSPLVVEVVGAIVEELLEGEAVEVVAAEGVHVLVVLLYALDVHGDGFGKVVELAEVAGHGDFGAFHAVVEARVRAAGEVGQEIVGEDLEGLTEYEKKALVTPAVDALKEEVPAAAEEEAPEPPTEAGREVDETKQPVGSAAGGLKEKPRAEETEQQIPTADVVELHSGDEAKYKLCKVRAAQFGDKGVPHITTFDGRTIKYSDPLIKANDTVKINLETGKVGENLFNDVVGEETLRMIEVYREFAYTQAAIPVVVGRESRLETFAGVAITYKNEVAGGEVAKFPVRVNAVPPRIASGSVPSMTAQKFKENTKLWEAIVSC